MARWWGLRRPRWSAYACRPYPCGIRTIQSWTETVQALQALHTDPSEAQQEARWLLDEVRTRYGVARGDALPPAAQQTLQDMVARRQHDEPLGYVIGHQPFGALSLQVRAPILLPRMETEAWALRVASIWHTSLATKPRAVSILDLCTGSGCIGLLLAHELRAYPDVRVCAVDYDAEAVALARTNAAHCGLHMDVHQLDVWDDTAMASLGPFDLVVCNPPYIPEASYRTLDRSVKAYESRAALVGTQSNADGLAYYRRVVSLAPIWLHPGLPDVPRLVLEVGAGQAEAVDTLCEPLGRTDVWRDDAGWDRVVTVYGSSTQRSSNSSRQ